MSQRSFTNMFEDASEAVKRETAIQETEIQRNAIQGTATEEANRLRRLTDDQLHHSSLHVADRERVTTVELLKHLNEIERRHLFSRNECESLHAYCVKYLKMSDPQAGRRVSASRLIGEFPRGRTEDFNGRDDSHECLSGEPLLSSRAASRK